MQALLQSIPFNLLLLADKENVKQLLDKETKNNSSLKKFHSIEAAVYIAEKYPEFVRSYPCIFLNTLFECSSILQKYLIHSFVQNKDDAQFLINKIVMNGYINYNYCKEDEIKTLDEVIDSLCDKYGNLPLECSREKREELRRIIGCRDNIGIY